MSALKKKQKKPCLKMYFFTFLFLDTAIPQSIPFY